METRENFKALVGKLFPDLHIAEIKEIDIGWSSYILEVNGKYIVKVPKSKESAEGIEKEMLITNALRNMIPLSIPHYISSISTDTLVAASYELIQGSMFTTQPVQEEFRIINPSLYRDSSFLRGVAKQIGETLHSIHSIQRDVVEPVLKRFITDTWEEKMSGWFQECRSIGEKGLSHDDITVSRRFLDALEEAFLNIKFEEKFIHGDYGGWNMLFDPATLHFTGLLDWADSRIGDPAKDFTELIYDFGEPFVKDILHYYGETVDPTIIERAELYLKLAGFQDLDYGMRTGSEFFLERGKRDILNELKNFR